MKTKPMAKLKRKTAKVVFNAKVADLMKAGLSRDEAIALAARENPTLYSRVKEEADDSKTVIE